MSLTSLMIKKLYTLPKSDQQISGKNMCSSKFGKALLQYLKFKGETYIAKCKITTNITQVMFLSGWMGQI